MKRYSTLSLILLLLVGVMFTTACEKDPTDPTVTLQNTTYKGYSANKRYTLTIYEVTQPAATTRAYDPQPGDTYKLTTEPDNRTSEGTVTAIAPGTNSKTLTLEANGTITEPLRATINSDGLRELQGLITWTDGQSPGTDTVPGVITAGEIPEIESGEFTALLFTGGTENNPMAMLWVTGVSDQLYEASALPAIAVTVNNTVMSSSGYTENLSSEDGLYYYEWTFYNAALTLVPGTNYTIALSISGTVKTETVQMPYKPVVSRTPTTFAYNQNRTYNWTLTQSANIQYAVVSWTVGQNTPEIEITLTPSDRTYLLTANTVPSNWSWLGFELGEGNFVQQGNIIFATSLIEYTDDYGTVGSPRSIDSKSINTQMVKLLRSSR